MNQATKATYEEIIQHQEERRMMIASWPNKPTFSQLAATVVGAGLLLILLGCSV